MFRACAGSLVIVLLCSCVIHSRVPDGPIPEAAESAEPIRYSLSLALFERHRGITSGERASQQSGKYVASYASFATHLEAALRRAGFRDPVAAGDPQQGDAGYRLAVHVEEARWAHYALPQEWLTGLSLGLIPSWGTRQEWLVRLELHSGEGSIASENYTIQSLTVSHLLLIPAALFQSADGDLVQFAEAVEHFLATALPRDGRRGRTMGEAAARARGPAGASRPVASL